jgi:hypothetical protein
VRSVPTLEEWTYAMTGMTLVVVLVQLWVMIDQGRIAKRQLVIVQKQDELLARRAELEMQVATDGNINSVTFRFHAKNNGQKGARDFYWHLWIPLEMLGTAAMLTGPDDVVYTPQGVNTFEGVAYNTYSNYMKDPVYPSRRLIFAQIGIHRERLTEPRKFGWVLATEDGAFPPQSGEKHSPKMIDVVVPRG